MHVAGVFQEVGPQLKISTPQITGKYHTPLFDHPATAVSLTCSVPAGWSTPRMVIKDPMDSLSQVIPFLPGCCAPSMLSTLRRMDREAFMWRLPSRRWASWPASARSGRLKLSVPCVTNSDSVRPELSGAVCQ